MRVFDFVIGVILGNKLEVELIEIMGLIGYLIFAWKKETRLTKAGFLSIINTLLVDVIVFHCQRPFWLCVLFNIPSVFGWLWLYEKLKKPCQKAVRSFLGHLCALFI